MYICIYSGPSFVSCWFAPMARLPRSEVFNPGEVGVYHCWSRCVRRAYLCGEDPYTGKNYDHRKDWIMRRLRHLMSGFSIDLLAYAVLDNHLHLVPRARPDVVTFFSDREVALRWWHVCPMRQADLGEPAAAPTPVELNLWLSDPKQMCELRQRLCDVSWLMRLLRSLANVGPCIRKLSSPDPTLVPTELRRNSSIQPTVLVNDQSADHFPFEVLVLADAAPASTDFEYPLTQTSYSLQLAAKHCVSLL